MISYFYHIFNYYSSTLFLNQFKKDAVSLSTSDGTQDRRIKKANKQEKIFRLVRWNKTIKSVKWFRLESNTNKSRGVA